MLGIGSHRLGVRPGGTAVIHEKDRRHAEMTGDFFNGEFAHFEELSIHAVQG